MGTSPPSASLVEFSCASKPSGDLPRAALLRMAQQAWSRNARFGVTGSLSFRDGVFDMVIEGPSDVLLPLVSRILTDPRHEAISILGFRPIATRRFDQWNATGFDMTGDIPIVDRPSDAGRLASARRDGRAKVANIRG